MIITPANMLRVVLLAAISGPVLATRVFVAFDPIRIKVVQEPVAAVAGAVHVRVTGDRVTDLQMPFALVARVHNTSTETQTFALRVDDHPVCHPSIGAHQARRIDCAVAHNWNQSVDHDVTVEGPAFPWTLEYLELATHYGNSTGFLNFFIVPAASKRYAPPAPGLLVVLGLALTGFLMVPRPPLASALLSFVCSLLTGLGVALFALVLVASVVSPYRIVLSVWTFIGWSCLLQAQLVAVWAPRVVKTAWERVGKNVWEIGRNKEWRLAWVLSVAVFGAALALGSRALGGADTYGYVSEADLWLSGDLKIDQSFAKQAPWPDPQWTFSPLGYRPHPVDGQVIVPIYSPGLPILLAAAKKLGGQDAMFWVVPMCTGLLILATYGLGRRFGSGAVGLAGAWLVATSPVVLMHALTAMSDVPVAAAWASAFYMLLGTSPTSAIAAGLLASAATLIRPNLAPLAAVLGLRYLLGMRDARLRRRSAWLLLLFGVAALPGPLAVAAINQYLFGSPLTSGYGKLSELFAWSRVPINLRQYLGWLVEEHTPVVLCGLTAVFVPLRRIWPWTSDRAIFAVVDLFIAMLWLIYCSWLVFDTWFFSRFLLSSWPFIMLGVGAVAAALVRRKPRLGPTVVWSVVVLGLVQLRFADTQGVFNAGRGEHRNIAVAQLVRRVTEPNSVTISLIHSGSVRYYGARMTLNYAYLDGQWLDRAVDWLKDHGVHTYAVLEDWEVPEFRQRFAAARHLAVLDGPPIAMYVDPGKLLILDLSSPPSQSVTPMVATGIVTGSRAIPPAPPPRLAFGVDR